MSVRQQIQEALARALGACGIVIEPQDVPLEFPAELINGDYASGVALRFAKQSGMAPRSLAEKLVAGMGSIDGIAKIEIAGVGFINFHLSRESVAGVISHAAADEHWGAVATNAGKQFLIEYTDPNPFKAFHIGHLMSNAIGEAIARLTEYSGGTVVRANYQGDLGVHVACAIWGIKKLGISPESADEFGAAYAKGATAYKEDADAKAGIDAINKKLYDRSDLELNALYDTGRARSLEAFERIYALLGTKFDRYFFESESGPVGKEIVLAHPDVFVESDGARVFKGEECGLHTRVFINSQGLPTYEAKELGLEKLKDEEFPGTDKFIVVTANEVSEYFKVVTKAMECVLPSVASRLTHVAHGMMKLPEGKMSSRTGSVITGESLIADLAEAAKERAAESRADDREQLAQQVAVAAIKYQILKQSSGKDIIFERERALSLDGDSGPYLQYAHARTCAILAKAQDAGIAPQIDPSQETSDLTRFLTRFPDIVARAAAELEPHLVTNFLLQVASMFNAWYAKEQILDGTSAAAHKVAIVAAVSRTLKNGLSILAIPAPEKM